jgi:hypothetical protein
LGDIADLTTLSSGDGFDLHSTTFDVVGASDGDNNPGSTDNTVTVPASTSTPFPLSVNPSSMSSMMTADSDSTSLKYAEKSSYALQY